MQTKTVTGKTKGSMKTNVIQLFAITVAALAALSSSAADRPARAAVEHAIEVKHVVGTAEYAYDSTGWRPLAAGKVLHPGAFVRTGSDSKVLIAMEEEGSFVRMGPLARLEISKAAPATEQAPAPAATQASVETKPALQVTYKFLQTRTLAALH
jgi:hypothetical protein